MRYLTRPKEDPSIRQLATSNPYGYSVADPELSPMPNIQDIIREEGIPVGPQVNKDGGRVGMKPGGLVEPGVTHYATSSWNVGKTKFNINDLDAGAKYYGYKNWKNLNDAVNKAKAAGDESEKALKLLRNRDAIRAQIKRKKKWSPPDVSLRGGAQAEWLDAVAEKIIDYTDNKDAKVFISRQTRAAKPGSPTTTVKGFLNQNQAKQFAKATDQQIAWLAEKSGVSRTIIKNAQTKYNALSASERRAQVMTKAQLKNMQAKVKIQSDILEQMNKGVFNSKQMAKNLGISHNKLIDESEKLIKRIYSDNMKIRKGLNPSGVGLSKDLTKNEALLNKIWKVEGFQGPEQRNWRKLVRDAFDSNRITRKQFILANDNLTNFYRMKNEIQLKYPKLILNLDHPLSHGALKSLGAKGEKFLTGVPTTERFNKGIKQKLDIGYKNVAADVRQGVPGAVEKKIAIEKIAKSLNIDIGEISPTGKKIVSLGKKDIVSGKTPLGRGIIESLQEQTELAKKIGKVDPKLAEAAGMKGYFKRVNLNKVSKNDLKGAAKILSDNGFTCKLAKGLTCNDPRAYIKSINEQKALSLAGDAKAAAKFNKVGTAVNAARGVSKFTLLGILGEVAFVPVIALPMLAKGESWSRIMNDISYGLYGESEQEELKRVAGTAGTQSMEALEAGEKLTRLESLPLAKKVAPVDSFIGGDPRRKEQLQARSAAVLSHRKKELEGSEKTFTEKLQPFMVNGSFDFEAFKKARRDVEAAKAQIAQDKLDRKESSIFFQDKLDPTEAMVGFDAGGRVYYDTYLPDPDNDDN